MFISAVKLGILTWGSMGIDLFLEPASSGHSKNCSFLALPHWLHFPTLEFDTNSGVEIVLFC